MSSATISGMRYRVYLPRFGEVLTGVMTEEEFEEAMEYREFFAKNDELSKGEGTYEVQLTPLERQEEQDRNIVARVTEDDLEFGYYGHEGWNPCISSHSRMVDETEVVFDTMIPYYIQKAEEYEEKEEDYSVEPDRDTVFTHVSDRDHAFLKDIIQEERENK